MATETRNDLRGLAGPGGPYRVALASTHGRHVYATCDTIDALATWLDAHADWAHTYSEQRQSRVERVSRAPLILYASYVSVEDDGQTSRKWGLATGTVNCLLSRIVPGHE